MEREEKIAESLAASDPRYSGTWALPGTRAKTMRVFQLVRMLRDGQLPDDEDPVTKYLSGLLGDDDLFDDLAKLQDQYAKKCAEVIVRWIKAKAKQNVDEFKDPADHEALVELAGKL